MAVLQYGFGNRADLGSYLNSLKLCGFGVEIGTHRGEFADQILSRWVGKCLFCVDPWTHYSERDCASLGDREKDKEETYRRLRKYRRRYRALINDEVIIVCEDRALILEDTSEAAAEHFLDGKLDFVYIDGNHEPEFVKQDLELWWPKIKPGGLLLGHDIICPGENKGGWGIYIQPIVHEFADRHGVEIIYLIVELLVNSPWSFYMVKP